MKRIALSITAAVILITVFVLGIRVGSWLIPVESDHHIGEPNRESPEEPTRG